MELKTLAQRMKQEALSAYVGRNMQVLMEGRSKNEDASHWYGYTPNFLQVQVPVMDDTDWENQILELRLEGLTEAADALIGRIDKDA